METEQITNTEVLNIESSTPKVKDPKKVKAGKALAKKNAEARKNVEPLKQEKDEEVDVSTIYNGILSIAGLVGAGFTLYHGWKFFETSNSLQAKFIPSKPKVEEPKEVKEIKKSKPVTASEAVAPLVSPSLRG